MGAKSAEKLLQAFGSIKKLRAASRQDVVKIVGKSMAEKVFKYLEQNNGEDQQDVETPAMS